ncbi:DegT/DnrJ/EryC1/StrS family aminotransferase [Halomonas nitroreducens]|uniref:DegT/DnrJ/EryC1/StrS family aminotransferase n=1 Tax=Halomonas nitroreducens TaxID=447425 RepID=A0A431V4X9_9GAMM|nr:DegT/DnrJ/EryC1/StrS family aminotransferase [Halomonas nitroreducens]RTR05327.1 DegT/DnrJ/EryC1/StrS family aminotransferase [Halomonas nitroreducens]
MIPVTKPYLPSQEKFARYVDGIYSRSRLTNQGPLVEELTSRLESHLSVENLLLVANGTLALQIAYRAVAIPSRAKDATAITTPFSFIATTSSLRWEGIDPIYVDIDARGWCLDARRVTAALDQSSRILVPVHVFGNACDVETLEQIAASHELKLIYDGAHAFGVKYRGKSLLRYGDATTLSFHATKLFHTIEGGAIVFRNREDFERARHMINHGQSSDGKVEGLGINAKMNEFQAAMGLCVLDDMADILERRAEIWGRYQAGLKDTFQLQEITPNCEINYSYFPIVFENEAILCDAKAILEAAGYFPRRYFYPSLETLSNKIGKDCLSNSRAVSEKVLCLPLYPELGLGDVESIIELTRQAVK